MEIVPTRASQPVSARLELSSVTALQSGIDTSIQHVDIGPHITRFEREFPQELVLLREVGIHPLLSKQAFDPYRGELSTKNFSNIGEHCIAVALAAERIALRLAEAGMLSTDEIHSVVGRALVHDLNKPYEIMRRDAQKGGSPEDIYSVSAYQALIPHLQSSGASPELVEYMKHAGSETGHTSLAQFLSVGPDGIQGLIPDSLVLKIVHLADDITFTSSPPEGVPSVTSFLTPWERMLASHFIEKYPFLWSEGLGLNETGSFVSIRDVKQPVEGTRLLGSYADLQVLVSHLISRELKLYLDPAAPESPEEFIKKTVRAV